MIRWRVLRNGSDLACQGLSGSLSWGRDDLDSQPASSTCSVTFTDPAGTIAAGTEVGDTLDVVATAAGRHWQRYSGEVVDVVADRADRTTTITAAGILSRLARVRVGDEPWPAELDGNRILRILELLGAGPDFAGSWADQDPARMWRWSADSWQAVGYTLGGPWAALPGRWVDADTLDDTRHADATRLGTWRDLRGPTVPAGELTIAARDVDSRPAAELLRDVAASALGVMYERRDGTLAYAPRDARTRHVDLDLEACVFTTDATFTRTTESVLNTLTVTYGPPAAGGGSRPSFTVTNPGSVTRFGRFDASWDTDLALFAEARLLAELHVARRVAPAWNLAALTFDSTVGGESAAADLMRAELGDTVRLSGLGPPAPAGELRLVVEGATERIGPDYWETELRLSAARLTVPGASWAEHAALDPGRRWVDAPGPWVDADAMLPPEYAAT